MENNFKKKSIYFRIIDKIQRRSRGNIFMILKNYYYYINSKIIKITRDKRAYIIKQLKKNTIIAEIGVWKGEFSNEILKNVSPKKLILVDPWQFNKSIRGCAPQVQGEEPLSQKFFDEAKVSTYNKFKGLDSVFIFDTDSESASKKFNDDYFDYIYIDGEHSFKAVYDDLTYWFPKLKKNGKIFGDDFYWREEDNSFSVKKAYEEFISQKKIKRWCVFKSQICIIK